MRLAITGADGFVGKAVAARLRETCFSGSVRLIDRHIARNPDRESLADWESLELDLCADGAIDRMLEGVDRVLHLAALPGGASEADPQWSRRVNLDLPLRLFERLDGRRIVYASSIAVFGECFLTRVDDGTVPQPDSVYGTHKRMVEIAFADAARRRVIEGMALRLPCVVARPPSASGFGSAFFSDVFHAAREGAPLTLPLNRDATSWMMSASVCADNLLHALLSNDSDGRAITLGAVRAEVGGLLTSLARYGDISGIECREDPETRRRFGNYPQLDSSRSSGLGFSDDGDVDQLVDRAMQRILQPNETRNFA